MAFMSFPNSKKYTCFIQKDNGKVSGSGKSLSNSEGSGSSPQLYIRIFSMTA